MKIFTTCLTVITIILCLLFITNCSMDTDKSKKLSDKEVKEKVAPQKAIETTPQKTAAQPPKTNSEVACLDLLLGKCTQCHTNTRFCQKLGKKSKGSWKRTLKRMSKKKDSTVTSEDAKILLPCIVNEEEAVKQVCK